MNFSTAGVGVLTAVLSFGALAEGGGDRTFALMMERNEKAMAAYAERNGKPAPQVQVYRYGMDLDIAKVVNVTPPIRACNTVPSRMTYEDSSGKLTTLEYQVMGVCRNNGS
ncbi:MULTISPECIES: DUF2790 domain-containing protein [Pseudomonas]|jgi:hypothetical protein|uniref:Uncharacterized protein DUF2790 n=1 Tax=Pseudomonas poae TaxID=200451 RepID=A0A7Z1GN48_9PSED|nr:MULTISPECIES: DUF2790 domain-containing protein [Pseudomonas]KAA8552865.1 hypothetical protein FX984_05383 [Pseudomonas marginalis]NMZ93334.1 DUF2790 domain-containing protein [Pseudomonas marginalis]PFG59797.1 uncharacterized protein DUF2790 [Pseudomonas poae]PUB45189.1 uncharacterized protein DUF2790 [Pseudomonas sp. GV047]TWR65118.1 DUF2790 domain-containing protein [Pseudomonas marginalis]